MSGRAGAHARRSGLWKCPIRRHGGSRSADIHLPPKDRNPCAEVLMPRRGGLMFTERNMPETRTTVCLNRDSHIQCGPSRPDGEYPRHVQEISPMVSPRALFLSAMTLCLAVAAPAQEASQSVLTAVRAANADFVQHWNKQEPAAIAALFTPNSLLVTPTGTYVGQSGFKNTMRPLLTHYIHRQTSRMTSTVWICCQAISLWLSDIGTCLGPP
jgi:hypothetical protein